MMDFSVEAGAESIVDSRTKRYFTEVYGCYAAGYYRSSVVMLWSVIVTDIMFKLDQLAKAYGDTTAQNILSEIETLRKKNPKSPDWEGELLSKVSASTDLIDQAEFASLQAIHIHRHLSAHPVITIGDALFSPNKETARAHIRNALEAVLTKPPIMSRKVFDTFLEDIEQISRLQPGPDGLRKYLSAKYFSQFSSGTFSQIFKSLWRVTFKSSDPRADSNRDVNVQALVVVFATRKIELIELIKSERTWFSDVAFQDGNIEAMVRFFQQFPHVFPLLSDALRIPIEKYAALDLNSYALCWFISESPDEHLNAIVSRIEAGETLVSGTISTLCGSLATSDALKKAILIAIQFYFKSGSFSTADTRFEEVIRPLLPSFDREHCIAFLKGCASCTNGQATYRGRAARDHGLVKDYIERMFGDLDINAYPAFRLSLGLDAEP